jgi:hypothetical protein
MTPATAEMVVTALYVGAGRRAGDAEMALWATVLEPYPDDGADAIVAELLRTVDFGQRPPTPALYLEHRKAWVRAQARPRPALDSPLPADGAERVAELRRGLREVGR